jgi:hypothetical protein
MTEINTYLQNLRGITVINETVLRNLILEFLPINLNINQPGSSYKVGGCSGAPITKAQYCD